MIGMRGGLVRRVLFLMILLAVSLAAAGSAGPLPVKNGKAQVEGEDGLILNLGTAQKPKYYRLARVSAPEGWKLTGTDANYDDNESYPIFESTEDRYEAMQCAVIAVKGEYDALPEQTAELMAQYFDGEASSIFEARFADRPCLYYWFIAADSKSSSAGTGIQFINAYFPANIEGTCIALNAQMPCDADCALSQDEVLRVIEAFAGAISLDS